MRNSTHHIQFEIMTTGSFVLNDPFRAHDLEDTFHQILKEAKYLLKMDQEEYLLELIEAKAEDTTAAFGRLFKYSHLIDEINVEMQKISPEGYYYGKRIIEGKAWYGWWRKEATITLEEAQSAISDSSAVVLASDYGYGYEKQLSAAMMINEVGEAHVVYLVASGNGRGLVHQGSFTVLDEAIEFYNHINSYTPPTLTMA